MERGIGRSLSRSRLPLEVLGALFPSKVMEEWENFTGFFFFCGGQGFVFDL